MWYLPTELNRETAMQTFITRRAEIQPGIGELSAVVLGSVGQELKLTRAENFQVPL